LEKQTPFKKKVKRINNITIHWVLKFSAGI